MSMMSCGIIMVRSLMACAGHTTSSNMEQTDSECRVAHCGGGAKVGIMSWGTIMVRSLMACMNKETRCMRVTIVRSMIACTTTTKGTWQWTSRASGMGQHTAWS